MTEILFYHLQRQPLEKVLPQLLEKSFERGWRVCVQTPKAERLEKLDEHLWTYSEGGFLPHGIEGQADLADEPIALTQADDNPNGATVRFLVDGAPLPDAPENYQRIVLMFDGYDEEALAAARSNWKEVRVRGLDATYLQQNDEGRWEKKA